MPVSVHILILNFFNLNFLAPARTPSPPIFFKNEKAAQRVSFGAGYLADVHADIPADVRGQKLRSSPRNPGRKNKHFGADVHHPKARTSMTPGGFKKTSVRKTSG